MDCCRCCVNTIELVVRLLPILVGAEISFVVMRAEAYSCEEPHSTPHCCTCQSTCSIALVCCSRAIYVLLICPLLLLLCAVFTTYSSPVVVVVGELYLILWP